MKRIIRESFIKKLSIIIIALLGFNYVYADETDDEIFTYIIRQSRKAYENHITQYGTVSDPQWEDAIQTAFTKLIAVSGEREFDLQISLIKDPAFNAGCYPGGEFVINSGTLEVLNSVIKKQAESDPGMDTQAQREILIAPVIAHELGHYYNRHQFKIIKKMMELLASSTKDIELKKLQYSVSNEYEADYTGYILLQKAGYDAETLSFFLELLNVMYQKDLKEAGTVDNNQYFMTHPSPHKRLAKFSGNRQKYHEIAAELEKAFDDVRVGINLERAIDYFEKSENEFPGNLYIKKERAVALHKLWLSTVSIDEQILKGIIDSPPFRDDMVFKSERENSRGTEIPGNKEYYNKALDAYMNIYRVTEDPAFYSNLALLLVYSTEQEKKKLAIQLSSSAAEKTKRMDLSSNFAMILFLLNEKEKALHLMATLAVTYDKRYQAINDRTSGNSEFLTYIQGLQKNMNVARQLNSSYVVDDFTPLLNLALMARYTGKDDIARNAAEKYLTTYENQSKWAKYLSGLTGIPIKERGKTYLSVDGVRVMNTIQQVLDKWGKADHIFPIQIGEEQWYYSDRDVRLSIVNGIVAMISLDSGKSRQIENGIKVGFSMQDIEKTLGKHDSIKSGYYIYNGNGLAVMYVKNMAKRIVLIP